MSSAGGGVASAVTVTPGIDVVVDADSGAAMVGTGPESVGIGSVSAISSNFSEI